MNATGLGGTHAFRFNLFAAKASKKDFHYNRCRNTLIGKDPFSHHIFSLIYSICN